MRVRLLSPYPLIVAANGRPIDPPAIVELPDDFARALEAQFLLEAAPDADITAEATVLGLTDAPAPAPAEAPALADLTKSKLVALAKDELGLDLDPDLKKDELIAAIEAARAEKAKA